MRNLYANSNWFKFLEDYEKSIYSVEVVKSHPGFRRFESKNNYDPKDALEEVDIPYLAVYGKEDKICPVDASI